MEAKVVYFDKTGAENTDETLRVAKLRADELGIKTVVVASTEGSTATKAVDVFAGMKVVVVTHAYGRRQPNAIEFTEENRRKVESKGGYIYTGGHAFTGLDGAVSKRFKTASNGEIILNILNMFGRGVKTAIEIALMAADAGLVRTDEDVIAIAGTHRGAYTAMVFTPVNIVDFFDLRIKEILCKPYEVEKFVMPK